jgi:hypothetical protein
VTRANHVPGDARHAQRHEENAGRFLREALQWVGKRPIDALSSPRIGTVRGVLPDKRSGAHQTFGFLSVGGRGTRSAGRLDSADIIDIAPTILTLQGVAVPARMDGRALADMLVTGA